MQNAEIQKKKVESDMASSLISVSLAFLFHSLLAFKHFHDTFYILHGFRLPYYDINIV